MSVPPRLMSVVSALFAATILLPVPLSAQLVFESVGERALGMGGAFVAVADDATAVHWNPAGLVGGDVVGMTIGWHRFHVGNRDVPPARGASQGRSSLTSLGTWPLGVSYGTVQRTWLVSGDDNGDDNDEVTSRSLRVGHVGVTVLQTLIDGLVVGSTLKLVRGGFVTGPVEQPTAGAALEVGADLKGDRRTTFDLDVGILASAPRMNVGLTLKNLRSPSFREAAGNTVILPRQSRLGVALRPTDGLTLAMDLDLNTVDLMGDLRRMLAVGGEAAIGARVRVRSGARWNLAANRQVIGTLGASVSVRRGIWLDGHYAMGRSDEAREAGVALRAGF